LIGSNTHWLSAHNHRIALIWKTAAKLKFVQGKQWLKTTGLIGELSRRELEKLWNNATSQATKRTTKFGMKFFNGKLHELFCHTRKTSDLNDLRNLKLSMPVKTFQNNKM
jgi:hypothetical protein